MIVLLRNGLSAGIVRAFHGGVLAIEHDVIVNINTVFNRVTARLCVWALDHELIEHVLYGPGHWHGLLVGIDTPPTRWTCLEGGFLDGPSMPEALLTEHVLAGELHRLVERRHTDQAHEDVAALGGILELLHVGRELGDAAVSTLG